MQENAHRESAAQLAAPWFLLSVAVLLLNDLVLKQAFPGLLTGKLSDFAGLFAFPFFFAVLLPRLRLPIYLLTAVSFVLWKLPVSTPVIEIWNRVSPMTVGRVVDSTDLIALCVLPLSFFYLRQGRGRFKTSVTLRVGIVLISLFAFTATSYRTQVRIDGEYLYPGTKETFLAEVESAGMSMEDGPGFYENAPEDSWLLGFPSETLCNRIYAAVTLSEDDGATRIRLYGMGHNCPRGRWARRKLLKEFTSNIVEPFELERIDHAVEL